ncbi:hypothetical protein [Pseudopedobacter saltans]|nr:hypothetical protein [Pseudopedobacter saltans]
MLISNFSLAETTNSIQGFNNIDSLIYESIKLARYAPIKGLEIAERTLKVSKKKHYNRGIAESFRSIGINYHNSNKKDSAIFYYLKALDVFKKTNDTFGIAKVYNNLGNSYKYFNNQKAIYFYNQTIKLSQEKNYKNLTAASYLSIGSLSSKEKDYKTANYNFFKALQLFKEINDIRGLMLTYQNMGVNFYYQNEISQAEANLIKAYEIAKVNNNKISLSSINLTLASINMAKQKYQIAKNNIDEGIEIAKELYDEKLIYDFTLTSYELEKKQGNYKSALANLEQVHSRDSLYYKENVSNILSLHEEQQKSLEKQKQYEIQIEKQEKYVIIMVFAVIVAALSISVIVILNKSKRKAERNNIRLKKLNEEISIQKENLNQINLKLEDIITERTKDLTVKNRKLSEYSSHLSHQIRGPVATLKGLIMLAEDELINEKEYIKQMKKCVDDIDDQIMDINIALHDASREGLNKEDE